eukprot:gene11677-11820_t
MAVTHRSRWTFQLPAMEQQFQLYQYGFTYYVDLAMGVVLQLAYLRTTMTSKVAAAAAGHSTPAPQPATTCISLKGSLWVNTLVIPSLLVCIAVLGQAQYIRIRGVLGVAIGVLLASGLGFTLSPTSCQWWQVPWRYRLLFMNMGRVIAPLPCFWYWVSAAFCWVAALVVDAADPTAACGQSITCLTGAVQELVVRSAATAASQPVLLAGQVLTTFFSSTGRSYLAQCLLPGLLLSIWELKARRAWATRQHQLQIQHHHRAPVAARNHPGHAAASGPQAAAATANAAAAAAAAVVMNSLTARLLAGADQRLSQNLSIYRSRLLRSLVSVKLQAPIDSGLSDASAIQQQLAESLGVQSDDRAAELPGQPQGTLHITEATGFPGCWQVAIWVLGFKRPPPDDNGQQEQQEEEDGTRDPGQVDPPQAPAEAFIGRQQDCEQLVAQVLQDWPGWSLLLVQHVSSDVAGFYLTPPAMASLSDGSSLCLRIAPAAVQQLQQLCSGPVRVVVTQQSGCALLLDETWEVPKQSEEAAGMAPAQDPSLLLELPACSCGSGEPLVNVGAGCQVFSITLCQQQAAAGSGSEASSSPGRSPAGTTLAAESAAAESGSTVTQHGASAVGSSVLGQLPLLVLPAAAALEMQGLQKGLVALGLADSTAYQQLLPLMRDWATFMLWSDSLTQAGNDRSTMGGAATDFRRVKNLQLLHGEFLNLGDNLASCFDDLGMTECYKLVVQQQWQLRMASGSSSTSPASVLASVGQPAQTPPALSDHSLPTHPPTTARAAGRGATAGFTSLALGLRFRHKATGPPHREAAAMSRQNASGVAAGINRFWGRGVAMPRTVSCFADDDVAAGGVFSWNDVILGFPLLRPVRTLLLNLIGFSRQPAGVWDQLSMMEVAIKAARRNIMASQQVPAEQGQTPQLQDTWYVRVAQWRGPVVNASMLLQLCPCAGLACHEVTRAAVLRAMKGFQANFFVYLLGSVVAYVAFHGF